MEGCSITSKALKAYQAVAKISIPVLKIEATANLERLLKPKLPQNDQVVEARLGSRSY
jgi:hypothetical protein